MRVRYEQQRDLDNEARVVRLMAEHKIEMRKLPISYRLDYAMFRDNKLRGFAEVKTRSHKHDRYPTLMISLGKVVAAQHLADVTKTRSVLLVQYLDGIFWTDFKTPHEVLMGGRTDRGDAADIEPCAHYPIEAFTMV